MIEEIEPLVICPMCLGTGEDYNPKHKKIMECWQCGGRKYIPLASCKGCGHAAWYWWPNKQIPIVRFCGRDTCLARLVKVYTQAEIKALVAVDRNLPAAYRPKGGFNPSDNLVMFPDLAKAVEDASTDEEREQLMNFAMHNYGHCC